MTDTSTQTAGPPPHSRSALDDLFDRLHAVSLRRDTDRRWFGGVCSGIAGRVGVDPLLIRAAAIALTIAGGVGLVVYLVLWFLLPDRYDRVLAEGALRHGDTWPVVLGVVIAVLLFGGVTSALFGGNDWGGTLWLVIPVVLVVWFLATRTRPGGYAPWPGSDTAPGAVPPPPPPGGTPMSAPTSSFAPGTSAPAPGAVAASTATAARPVPPPPPAGPAWPATPQPPSGGVPPAPPVPPRPVGPPVPPRPRRRRPSGFVGLVSLGLVILLGGLGTALAGPVGFPGSPAILGMILALAGVAAVVLGLGLSGRASGFSGFLVVVLAVATMVAALVAHSPATRGGLGDREWTPTNLSLPAEYSLGAGDATLDLSRLSSTGVPDGATVDAELGAGQIDIVVPKGLTVRVEAHTGVGEIRWDAVSGDASCAPPPRASGDDSPLVLSRPDCIETQDVRSGSDRSATYTTGDGGDPDVVVHAELGFGDITIQEQR